MNKVYMVFKPHYFHKNQWKIGQSQKFYPHEDNKKAVKHCLFAIAKNTSVSSKETFQIFKPKAPRKVLI